MSDLADVEERARRAAELHERSRQNELRERLTLWCGRTVVFDLSDPEHHRADLHARIESVGTDSIEVIDLSDARLPPHRKPVRRIELARIRDVRIV